MNLDLINNIVNNMKSNKVIQGFVKELQNYLESEAKNNFKNIGKEKFTLDNSMYNTNKKFTTIYRDKMNIKRAQILRNYASQMEEKGEMYYIYDKNSKMGDGYNLCIYNGSNNPEIIEKNKNELPYGSNIGSILRKIDGRFILDEEASKEISQEIYNMEEELLEQQSNYLESKRIEGHIYEMSEKDQNSIWLFDVTNEKINEDYNIDEQNNIEKYDVIDSENNIEEGFEEIDFPKELLKNAREGDIFIYKNGEYQQYYT